MIFITVEDVIDYHTDIINEFGGSHGIQDLGLLISAVEMPKASLFGEYLHPTLFDQAAAYLFHTIGNHPFIDGNKRTGAVTALTFLASNEILLKYEPLDLEDPVIKTAQGKTKKEEISAFFQKSYEGVEI